MGKKKHSRKKSCVSWNLPEKTRFREESVRKGCEGSPFVGPMGEKPGSKKRNMSKKGAQKKERTAKGFSGPAPRMRGTGKEDEKGRLLQGRLRENFLSARVQGWKDNKAKDSSLNPS